MFDMVIFLFSVKAMGWKLESFRLGMYLSVPLIALTMSNWPSIVDYYHNAYRVDIYEKTGVRFNCKFAISFEPSISKK